MNRRPLVPLLLLLLPLSAVAQNEKIEWDWVREDSTSIAKMITMIKERPLEVLSMDALPGSEAEDLGFGYSLRETMTSGAYVATRLQIVLRNGVPVSFAATPRMPFPFKKLQKTYRKFYLALFSFDSSGAPKPYYWKLSAAASAIEDSIVFKRLAPRFPEKTPSRDRLDYLMSPYSGVDYGCGGPMGGRPYENRELFNQLRPLMTYRVAIVLLRSINPATRLMALEFLKRELPKKIENKSLAKDIETTLTRFPMVMTRHEGMRRPDNVRALLDRFMKENCDPHPITARSTGRDADDGD